MWGPTKNVRQIYLFSRFDVYWIQTDRQTDKQSIYIDRYTIYKIYTILAEGPGGARGKKI